MVKLFGCDFNYVLFHSNFGNYFKKGIFNWFLAFSDRPGWALNSRPLHKPPADLPTVLRYKLIFKGFHSHLVNSRNYVLFLSVFVIFLISKVSLPSLPRALFRPIFNGKAISAALQASVARILRLGHRPDTWSRYSVATLIMSFFTVILAIIQKRDITLGFWLLPTALAGH